MMPTLDLDAVFTYHAPFGTQAERYHDLRQAAKFLALRIQALCPDSRERATALTNVQQAVMWANAAIAIHESEGGTDGQQS
jgi:hypothetical protein